MQAKGINVSSTDSPALQSEVRGPSSHTLEKKSPGHQEVENQYTVMHTVLALRYCRSVSVWSRTAGHAFHENRSR
jgi:hypothetical protein